jgi:hypothetical protein
MFSKTTLAIFAALTATASVTALPTQYSEYADLVERDFYDNAELVERDYFDAFELAERDLFDMDFEELAARQDPSAAQVDPTAAQAGATAPPAGAVAPPTQVSSAPGPHPHGHGHGHGRGSHGHGHGPHGPHGHSVGRHGRHSHGHHGPIPAHHLKADGTRKSRSGRRRANRRLRKQQAAAAATQGQTAPSPQPQGAPGPDPSAAAAGAGAMAPPVVAREILLEERGLLETLGLKARVANLSAKQTSKMNAAKTVCAGLSSKKDQKKCHKNVDKIIQLTKERNYDVEQFNKIAPGHESVFAPADATTATHPASSLLSLGARY